MATIVGIMRKIDVSVQSMITYGVFQLKGDRDLIRLCPSQQSNTKLVARFIHCARYRVNRGVESIIPKKPKKLQSLFKVRPPLMVNPMNLLIVLGLKQWAGKCEWKWWGTWDCIIKMSNAYPIWDFRSSLTEKVLCLYKIRTESRSLGSQRCYRWYEEVLGRWNIPRYIWQ